MNQGKTVFAQLLQFVPFSHFENLVDIYQANKGAAAFSADQTILLATPKSKLGYPGRLRRVSFRDPETGKHLVFFTNLHDVPALTIAKIYKNRWQIELFFKWLKQNLAVKHFFGNSINAVKSQIWVAVCAYLLVLIAINYHRLLVSPQIFLHIVETNIFEKITLDRLVVNAVPKEENPPSSN